MARVFIPKENKSGETRVAATPETVKKMVKAGLAVRVEAGAGDGAAISDAQFQAAGAEVVTAADGYGAAEIVLKVQAPSAEEAGRIPSGALLVAFLAPHKNADLLAGLAARGVRALAMERIPRITRAQAMDALSSQASISGYKAVLLAAARLGKYFPLLMTAAGTIPPAKVVVMGAGVAGLQALATAKRLGAVVEVSDVRAAVKEQVQSLGGKFIDLPAAESGEGQGGYAREMGEDFLRRQREIIQERLAQADVVITTALVPGKPAPRLISREMVEAMKPGSVIVDLAIEAGGNCELSQADTEVVHGGVILLAPSNLPASVAFDAATLYSRNVLALLQILTDKGELALDLADEIVAAALVTPAGESAGPISGGAPASRPASAST